MSIIKIVIKGCSGYGPVDMAYDDKLTLTQTSISYEYKPYMESETNPSRKWSHRTNSPLFKVGFERVVATMPSVLEPEEVWECTDVGPDHLSLHLVSPDGEENYPACLTLDVTYTLTDEGLGMEYRATSDGTTPVNLTNHAYFNLAGCRGESILPYLAWINADYYPALNELLLPVADLPVDGTSFDFRQKRPIGTPMEAGYDNNFRLLHTVTEEVGGKTLPLVATVENGALRFKLYTDQPCMQFYIGNALCDPLPFRGGVEQIPHTTFCMEAQIRPDSPTHGEGFLHAGEVYTQSTFYAFERL